MWPSGFFSARVMVCARSDLDMVHLARAPIGKAAEHRCGEDRPPNRAMAGGQCQPYVGRLPGADWPEETPIRDLATKASGRFLADVSFMPSPPGPEAPVERAAAAGLPPAARTAASLPVLARSRRPRTEIAQAVSGIESSAAC